MHLWTWLCWRQHPIRMIAIVFHLILRVLFAVFWLAAGANKIVKQWLTTDTLQQAFFQRLTELPPDSFAVWYLETLAIPWYLLIAWFVTVAEIYIGIALLLGLTTRWAGGLSLFILLNFAIGGYYDASLLPFFFLSLIFMSYPSGQWLGLDYFFSKKYPGSKLFF